jgi:hypothetical protein
MMADGALGLGVDMLPVLIFAGLLPGSVCAACGSVVLDPATTSQCATGGSI